MLPHRKLIRKLITVDRIDADLNGASVIVCMSEILRDACVSSGIDAEKIVVLGNRVSLTRFQMKPQANYEQDRIRMLYVGRLAEQKNVHGITAAMGILREDGWKVFLDICGGHGMNDYLRQSVKALDDSEWRYWGSVPNGLLPERFNEVDMYVGPSFYEGFQIPLIEALACGKPCVASDQAPANEIIDARIGALVDPADPASIAQGIIRVKSRLNDPEAERRMRALCRVMAVRRWGLLQVAEREAMIYRGALGHGESHSDQHTPSCEDVERSS